MSPRGLPFSGIKHRSRWVSAALATATAITIAGVGVAPAESAPSSACPQAYPSSDLVRDQPVTGLTVTEGTTPEQFTGEIIGVLENGIMPGLDMIMARLSSADIDKAGIWQGMSGSPVYAADGRLIGAVSYGLAWGPSPVAGITPAADMQELLRAENDPDPEAAAARKVDLPARMSARIVDSGAASADEVDSGMAQLKIPFGIAGLGSQKRLDQVAKQLDLKGVRLMRAGTTSSAASDASPMVPGGNLAASIAYGDITAAGIGTTTMVCGDEVVGFGHPFNWTGPTTMTMHGADALYIQEDPVAPGFKVANIGDPVGTISQDRMAGILGSVGAVPPTSDITSTVTSGTRSRDGETHVSVRDMVPDIAFSHLLANEDRVFDGIGKGSGSLGYTVTGTREDGTTFSLDRDDVYADPYDITFATAWDVYMVLSRLQYSGIEDITIDTVDADADLDRSYDHYTITRVTTRKNGEWVKVGQRRTLRLRAGTEARFKVEMTSLDSGPRTRVFRVPVKKRWQGRMGSLEVFGGNSDYSEDFYYEEEGQAADSKTFDQLLKEIEKAPRNDDLVVDLTLYDRRGDQAGHRQQRSGMDLVVDGRRDVSVRIVR